MAPEHKYFRRPIKNSRDRTYIVVDMFKKRRVNSHSGERIVLKTKPRFMVHSAGVFFKVIIVLLILYFFRLVLEWIKNITNSLDAFIQLPLVEWTTYVLLIVILVLILGVAYDYLCWRQKKYTLTNHRIIVQSGIIKRKKATSITIRYRILWFHKVWWIDYYQQGIWKFLEDTISLTLS